VLVSQKTATYIGPVHINRKC